MKRQIKLYTALAGFSAMMLLGSCGKKFLDTTPYVSVPTESAFETVSDIENAVNGSYAGLTETDYYGRSLPVIGDLMGDNTYISVNNSGRYTAQQNYSVTVTDATMSVNWLDAYKVILRTNNIIDAVDQKFANDAAAKQFKAEALSIRALVYFNLIRVFAKPYSENPDAEGVPLILHYNRDLRPARNKVSEVYTQILADLDAAYPLFTQTKLATRFSKYGCRGLAAKVNLYKGDYAKALSYAKDVIDHSNIPLLTRDRVAAYWSEATPSVSTPETLFEVGADALTNVGNDELGNMYNQLGYGDILCVPALYNLYGASDVRKGLILEGARDPQPLVYIVNKYQHTSGDFDNKKVLRISEMYLIAAEASNRLKDDVNALIYLNTLMAQRDPSLVYASAGALLLDDIILERRKELAFEGDRFHDLNRLKRNLVNGKGRVVNYGDTRRVAPVPQTERDANPNMTQNDGYTK
ncbi:RagB/SusD family nutrient uptake outer membrane protein [Chitinophaga sp. 22321]|uniref:RagB/SusD family nutrient uptake outer membrane protein n=1 Tax=Chitinophaga hostae TaxID=2831022 RepID=A0ABS5J758_9BACT|nr:RagB/SusD family nutrient uptake outer membrane protein [Chitinophaga hostae]MBS0031059.1 RagB/SusD family nutrient uptake outer membrane protein [Chitinophaga hostae]